VFEVSSRDIYLRAETLSCELDSKGHPIVEAAATLECPADAEAAQPHERVEF